VEEAKCRLTLRETRGGGYGRSAAPDGIPEAGRPTWDADGTKTAADGKREGRRRAIEVRGRRLRAS
jgi:hypothetical protein